MDRWLTEVANLAADLTNDEPAIADQRRYERFDRQGRSLGESWADPLTAVGGVAPINSRPNRPSVSGTRERSIPLQVDVHDLSGPARQPNPTAAGKLFPQDQVGRLSVATVVDTWVRDVRETLFPDHSLPAARVDEMVSWLRNRLDVVCDSHPAVGEIAAELKALRGALRAIAGEPERPAEHCAGVPCKRCDLLLLFRQGDGSVDCANVNCNAVYRGGEYQEWVATLAAEHRIKAARGIKSAANVAN